MEQPDQWPLPLADHVRTYAGTTGSRPRVRTPMGRGCRMSRNIIRTPLIFWSRQEARRVVPSLRPPKDGISNPVRSFQHFIGRNLVPLPARENFEGMVFELSPVRVFEPHAVVIIAARFASGILERTEPFRSCGVMSPFRRIESMSARDYTGIHSERKRAHQTHSELHRHPFHAAFLHRSRRQGTVAVGGLEAPRAATPPRQARDEFPPPHQSCLRARAAAYRDHGVLKTARVWPRRAPRRG
jgi:hypothetical protein